MSDRTPPTRRVLTRAGVAPFLPAPPVPVRSARSAAEVTALPPLVADLLDRRTVPCIVELHSPTRGDVRELASSHPLERLLGRRLPHRVEGLAVIAAGRVVDLATDDPVAPRSNPVPSDLRSADSADRDATARPGGMALGMPVWIAQVIWRRGPAVASLVGLDPSGAAGPVRPFVSSSGPIPDAMRRALDLPTAPPSSGPDGYWFLAWLSAVADSSVTDPFDVAAWHPGIDPRELDTGGLERDLTAFCIERLAEHGAITGWEGVRRSAAEGWLDIGSCEASLAAWFDEGSFSRHLIRQLVEPAEALDRLAPSLPAETNQLLARTLASLPPASD